MLADKRSSSVAAGRLHVQMLAFVLCFVVVALTPRTATAYVTVEATSAPSGAPSLLAASPTSPPTILEVPESFTKEPGEDVLDDAYNGDDAYNSNTTNDDFNSTHNNENSGPPSSNSTSANGGGGEEAVQPAPGPSTPESTNGTAGSSGSEGGGGSGTERLSTGGIVGIAFGAGIAVGLLLSLGFAYLRRERQEQRRSSGSGVLEVKQFSTSSSPDRKKESAPIAASASASTSSSKGSKGTADADEEDASDCQDPTEYSCTVSSSRGSDDALLHMAVSHPSYAQHALRALEEEDEKDVVLECEV